MRIHSIDVAGVVLGGVERAGIDPDRISAAPPGYSSVNVGGYGMSAEETRPSADRDDLQRRRSVAHVSWG